MIYPQYDYIVDTYYKGVTTHKEMYWTTELPKQEGWYWVYFHHDKFPSGPRLECVEKHRTGYLGIINGDYLEPLHEYASPLPCYFLGPLPVPAAPE